MKPNPDLSPRSREEIIRQLEQFSVEVLQAALGVLRARSAAAKSVASGKSDAG